MTLRLADLIRAEYATSGMTDGAFAALAVGRLNANVNGDQVRYVRKALNIASNIKPSALKAADMLAAMALLRQDLDALRVVVDRLLTTSLRSS